MRRIIVAVAMVLAAGCTSIKPAAPAPAARKLTVNLFPYIPDVNGDNFATLAQWLKAEFEKQHPMIEVTFVSDVKMNPYDSNIQKQLFSATGPNVVETDLVTLGDLVENDYVAEVTYVPQTFAFARKAARISKKTWAIPTWVCTFFFTSGPQSQSETAGAPEAWVSGTWDGSWILPALYLNAVAEVNGYPAVEGAVKQPVDPKLIEGMAKTMSGCSIGQTNDCMNSVFKNGPPGAPQIAFAAGKYANTTGFSETTFFVLKHKGVPKEIRPFRIVPGSVARPLAWTDGLVVNKHSCTGPCLDDAMTLAEFLNTNEVLNYIAFSGDAPKDTPPRYLSPSANSFYSQPKVKNNAFYMAFQPVFENAQKYPAVGFPAARMDLYKGVCDGLKKAGIPDACTKKPGTAATVRGGRYGGD
jgi:hypothetical protein